MAKIEESYPTLHKVFENTIDTQLRTEVRNRFSRDQSVNDINRPLYFYDNIMWLKTKMLENKFPNEDLIGIKLDNDQLDNPYVHIFLIHWFDNHSNDTLNLIPLLKKQINLGNLSPDFFASLKNIRPRVMYALDANVAYVFIGDSVLSPKFDEYQLKTINTNRQNIYLSNFSDYQKKIRCKLINKIGKGNQIDNYPLNNEDERKKAITFFVDKIGYEVIGDIKTIFNTD
jgi:hypothetical protein